MTIGTAPRAATYGISLRTTTPPKGDGSTLAGWRAPFAPRVQRRWPLQMGRTATLGAKLPSKDRKRGAFSYKDKGTRKETTMLRHPSLRRRIVLPFIVLVVFVGVVVISAAGERVGGARGEA